MNRFCCVPVVVLLVLVQGGCTRIKNSESTPTTVDVAPDSQKKDTAPTPGIKPIHTMSLNPGNNRDSKPEDKKVSELKEVASFKAPNKLSYLGPIQFSPDGKTLVTTSNYGPDKDMKLVELPSGKEITSKASEGSRGVFDFAPDGRLFVATDSKVQAWDLAKNEIVKTYQLPSQILQINLSPDGKVMVCVHKDDFPEEIDSDNAVSIVDVQTGKVKGAFAGSSTLAFSPDSRLLACATRKDYAIRIYDLVSDKETHLLKGHQSNIRFLAFADNKTLVSNTGAKVFVVDKVDTTVRIWNVETGKEQAVVNSPKEVEKALVFPDGKTLVTTYKDKTVTFWSVENGKDLGSMTPLDREPVWHLVFMPDGKTMITTHYDKGIILWEMPTRKKVLAMNPVAVYCLQPAFSPDGRLMALPYTDGMIKIYALNP
jgi:WD40 repeat protein